MTSFGRRLEAAFAARGQLCLGIDPHSWLLADWGLADSAAGALEFGLRTVDAAAGQVGIVKPQVAFFERFGSAGYAALEQVISAARASELLVIADVKRGDVGTSLEAYAQAWLAPGSPLEVDAMTVNPYQGFGSLQPALELADRNGKGVFVLAATSNPEAAELQLATTASERSVASTIVDDIADWNASRSPAGLGSAGVVLGATVAIADYGIDQASITRVPILAPGFGHQGARFEDLRGLYGSATGAVLVSVSRSILATGPDGIAAAIAAHAEEVAACLA